MTREPADPKLPELLSVSVHEFRSPVTVVAGYIRMLLKDRAGALTDPQRRLLEDAEKSCARLSVLLAEMSDLSNLEAGKAPFNRSGTDLRAVLAEAVAALAPMPDREIDVELATGTGPAIVNGDAVRLRGAFTSLVHAIRREVVTSPRLYVRERAGRIRRPACILDRHRGSKPDRRARERHSRGAHDVRRMARRVRSEPARRTADPRRAWRRAVVTRREDQIGRGGGTAACVSGKGPRD